VSKPYRGFESRPLRFTSAAYPVRPDLGDLRGFLNPWPLVLRYCSW
jgi:hypothetical protein